MEISTELLVADLAQKLRRGLIETHGPNLEADIRAAVVLAQSPTEKIELYLALQDRMQVGIDTAAFAVGTFQGHGADDIT